jgi:putative polyhydroxyalkanoate system protein
LAQARKIALAWAQELETEYGMECHHQKGKAKDALQFKGRGVSGTLHITPKQFELDATLGLFLGVKGKIEAAIVHKLNAQLALAPGQVNARSV